jgi:hypothetical protein
LILGVVVEHGDLEHETSSPRGQEPFLADDDAPGQPALPEQDRVKFGRVPEPGRGT